MGNYIKLGWRRPSSQELTDDWTRDGTADTVYSKLLILLL